MKNRSNIVIHPLHIDIETTGGVILFLMQKNTDNTQIATKADISRLEQSTKAEFKKLRTEIKGQRSESKRMEKSLRSEILKVEERVENVEEKMEGMDSKLNTMDGKLDKIAETLDGFVGRVDGLTEDNEIGANQIHELRKSVDNHEKRIEQLESPTQSA